MIEIRNLLFQPLTFQLAGVVESLHMGPRERVPISDEHVSEEMRRAAEGGLVTLSEVSESESTLAPSDSPEASESGTESVESEPTAFDETQAKRRR